LPSPIQQLFAAGCPVVVLCFDNYDGVPAYKAMTQLKRANHHPVCIFNHDQPLPVCIPDDVMTYLMNRNFKLKVIEYVCSNIPQKIQLQPNQRLLIDYKRVVEFTHESPLLPIPIRDMAQLGESDVKFARYVDR